MRSGFDLVNRSNGKFFAVLLEALPRTVVFA